ncbi:oligoendopeptidase F [Haloterrigena sp. SYSU A121-1]|uniref:Oligoendopeptidase F n=1 Tax=Haloterrigena gelatinilytica TaxID=2741724 RepID=A0A8J8GJU9_9EURY|nr:oligoendopeptidase F [Haloterrigena gelatinilytica]NUB89662.1 oligoendopeptidase F [Haloterrigena gelatinilytica]
MSSVPERSEVDEEYTWDLESIYATDDDWEAAYEAVAERVDELAAYEGQVTDDAETLRDVLELRDEIMREVSTVAAYARMRRDEDTTNQQYQALTARAQSLGADAQSAASFIDPEIQELTREEFDAMVDEVPALETYDHYVDDVLRMKPHTRSAEVEELLADLSEVTGATGEVYNMLANADMAFPTVEYPDSEARSASDESSGGEPRDGEAVEITQSNFVNLLKRPDREFRRTVHEEYYDEWSAMRNTVASAYKNSVKADVKTARARNYDTAREAALDGPNVPVDVYDTLVETVHDNIDKLHRHAELKERALGVDDLQMWDVYMPLTGDEGPDVEYDQATEYVVESLAPLGEEYQSRVAEGLKSNWVDVYENEGKQAGAYSGGTYDTQPFILMNYQDDISSMYTLAHELGHSMHSELTKEEQPFVYSSYEIFVAEVASTVNEALLTSHLLETVDDPEFKKHVLNEFLERVRSTLYRQTLFAEFEHETHRLEEEGEPLTADRLDELYRGLKEDYYEPAVVDDRIAREWMRIPHFYRAFYVYQYATGISAALAIVDNVLPDGAGGDRNADAADDYLEFLRRGSREYPLELLRIAGVDMSSSGPIDRALETYGQRLEEMEALME